MRDGLSFWVEALENLERERDMSRDYDRGWEMRGERLSWVINMSFQVWDHPLNDYNVFNLQNDDLHGKSVFIYSVS